MYMIRFCKQADKNKKITKHMSDYLFDYLLNMIPLKIQ